MNDSQSTDYLQIINSLLASRQQWQQIPQIVNLSLKAIVRELQFHQQSFLEHKTLINQQSLKIKQLQLKLGGKISRKDLQGEVLSILNSKSSSPQHLEESLSQYEKLIKQSRYERDRGIPPTVQELTTIAQIIADKRIDVVNEQLRNRLLTNKLEIQEKISNLKEDIKSRMVDIQKERRQWVSECRQAHSRLEQSALRGSHLLAEDKIGHLQHSNKRMSEGLSHLITHLQQNFLTKQQVNLLLQRQKEKQREKDRKSPPKIKERQVERPKKKDEQQLEKLAQKYFRKFKNEEQKERFQFKQTVNKEIGLMITIDTVNHIVDNLQKSLQENYSKCNAAISKLQQKYTSNIKSQQNSKEALMKSEKRVEKRTSPSKSIESIQSSLSRLQKNIVEKQNSQIKKIDEEVDFKLKKYDSKLMQELDRRQKHLCEVIEQTYNQSTKGNDAVTYKQVIKKLNDTNLYAKYLYFGSKQCKKESCIPWEKESLNNLVDNFIWKKDSSLIVINAAGLYKVEVGLYGNINKEATLLLNGDPFATISVPQIQKNTGIKVRGAIFSEFLLLPGKAKLSVRVEQPFYGQAFLLLQFV